MTDTRGYYWDELRARLLHAEDLNRDYGEVVDYLRARLERMTSTLSHFADRDNWALLGVRGRRRYEWFGESEDPWQLASDALAAIRNSASDARPAATIRHSRKVQPWERSDELQSMRDQVPKVRRDMSGVRHAIEHELCERVTPTDTDPSAGCDTGATRAVALGGTNQCATEGSRRAIPGARIVTTEAGDDGETP